MLQKALVSVIIPCYNQAHFLSKSIESVLAQDYPNVEIVVVDDGSTDNTAEVASKYEGVTCIQQDNQGLSAARNAGVAHTSGDYLVFLDADDRLLNGALTTGMSYFDGSAEYAFVAGSHRYIDEDGRPKGDRTYVPQLDRDDDFAALLEINHIAMIATVIFAREPLVATGGFDEGLEACEDYDAYLRLALSHPVTYHSHLVAEWRKHGKSVTVNADVMLANSLSVLRKWQPIAERFQKRREAYRKGISNWKKFYGGELAKQIESKLRSPGKRLQALGDAVTLLRDAPVSLPKHGINRLQSIGRRLLSPRGSSAYA